MTGAHEIGGYLELERFRGRPYHEGALALNCARGCFSYLIELRSIERIWVPDFMCGSVPALFRRDGVEVLTYRIGADALPDYGSLEVAGGEWMLLADYYGQLRGEDVAMALEASDGCLIVDETQGFFRSPWKGADVVYTCRKWFGVADGAYLATSDGSKLPRELPRDESHERMGFVLGRFERPAPEFFTEASRNNEVFACEPAKQMSALTENILGAIDYPEAKRRRDDNWSVLDTALSGVNRLAPRKPDGAFMYPLMLEGAQEVRRALVAERVYVPCLWPDVSGAPGESARCLAEGILPLPVDQRYGSEDMKRILEVLERSGAFHARR